ncbi:peptidoglycan-binding protein [Streptosporangium sp. G12]
MTTAAKVIAEARADLGMRESPAGSNLVPITREFGRIPGYPGGGYGYPWCAAATSVWCKAAGLKPNTDYPHTAGVLSQYSWAKAHKRWFTTPAVGDLVVYTTGGAAGIYHVELVEKVTASSITTIGGNTSGSAANGVQGNGDGCYRKTLSRSNARIYGYVRPRYAAAPATPKPPTPPKPTTPKPTPNWTETLVENLPTLTKGCEKTPALKRHIKTANKLLDARGFPVGEGVDDQTFGEPMAIQVRALQKFRGLKADGVIDRDTWVALH